MPRFSRVLLNDDAFVVVAGLFGGIHVSSKAFRTQRAVSPYERNYLSRVCALLRGVLIVPGHWAFERLLRDFAEAALAPGGAAWSRFFEESTPEELAIHYASRDPHDAELQSHSSDTPSASSRAKSAALTADSVSVFKPSRAIHR